MARQTRQPNRRQGRRGAPGCLSALFLVAVIAAVVVAAIFIFFKMKYIVVEGESHYSEARIIAASGAETGSNLVFIGKGSMRRGIESELPYVAEVTIRRRLPDTLEITVVETEAVAYFEANGAYWLTDGTGKLLERTIEHPYGLIRIDGVKPSLPVEGSIVDLGEESELRLRTYSDTLAALEKAGMLGEVASIDIGGLYDVQIECFGRFRVDFGAPEELDYKIEYLREIIDTKLSPTQKGSIDLSELIEKGEARFLEEY